MVFFEASEPGPRVDPWVSIGHEPWQPTPTSGADRIECVGGELLRSRGEDTPPAAFQAVGVISRSAVMGDTIPMQRCRSAAVRRPGKADRLWIATAPELI